eukprot:361871-Chlamydomonas_euryale.AAC.9
MHGRESIHAWEKSMHAWDVEHAWEESMHAWEGELTWEGEHACMGARACTHCMQAAYTLPSVSAGPAGWISRICKLPPPPTHTTPARTAFDLSAFLSFFPPDGVDAFCRGLPLLPAAAASAPASASASVDGASAPLSAPPSAPVPASALPRKSSGIS